jgi:hypothetical protein
LSKRDHAVGDAFHLLGAAFLVAGARVEQHRDNPALGEK